MNLKPTCVLDASALLAFVKGELGQNKVAKYLYDGAAMSAVNWTEVLSHLCLDHFDIKVFQREFLSVAGANLLIVPYEQKQSFEAASIIKLTKEFGLSLGDRACLSLGIHLELPVITADRAWERLAKIRKLEVDVICLR